FAMVGFGVTNLVVYFQVAARSRLFHALWGAALLEAVLITLFHQSGRQIAFVVLGSSASVATLGFLASRAVALSKTPLSRLPADVLVHPFTAPDADGEPELSLVVPAYGAGPGL